MKTSSEFYKEISIHHDAIRQICKNELTAMKEPFCKHECVELIVSNHPDGESYFEYKNLCNFIATSDGDGHKVCAIRHYIYEDEWTLMVKSQNGTYDEVCASQLKASDMIELVSLLKRELFNY